MTVSYSEHVFTSTSNGIFLKLLFRWKGSIYKLVWRDLVCYVLLYSLLSCIYRFILGEKGALYFEKISLFCGNFATLIPVTFVLGFYVSLLVTRWWKQFESIPWPDSSAVWISTCIKGHDERGRLMRRTIIRYINLCLILTFRLICLPVKKRFPTLQHLEDAGILQGRERQIFEKMDQDVSHHPKYWMPLVWAGSIVTRARKENRIANDYMMLALIEQIDKFRGLAGGLINHDWVTIPLVYTQVVTLAVYTFLLSTLMGRQFLNPAKNYPGHDVDLVIPWFTFLQFFFYMGWLKVAEALINPFGEDDDDFEANWMIDRNLQVSYLIVDEMHAEHPEMVRDQFWDDLYPELPYTAAAEETRTDTVMGGTANYQVPNNEAEFLPMSVSEEDEDEDDTIRKTSQDLAEIIISGKGNSASKLKLSPKRHLSDDSEEIRKISKPIQLNGKNLTEKRGEFGSFLSVDKSASQRPLIRSSANSASGVSLVSRLHSVLRGRGGPGSMFGNSHISLMSRASRNRGQRSRKQSSLLGRSASRMSESSMKNCKNCDDEAGPEATASSRPHSGSESQSDEDGEESMFKFSSMSSVDHLNGSANDLDSTAKQRVRKKNSVSSGLHSPKLHVSESGGKIHGSHTFSGGPRSPKATQRNSEQNKALVRKLELMHNFTTEAVRLLKSEDELKNAEDSSQQYLFRALEENHEELRRLLLKRLKPRPHRNSMASTALGSPATMAPTSTTIESFKEASDPFDPFEVGGLSTEAGSNSTILMGAVEGNNGVDVDLDDEDGEVDKSNEDITIMYNDNLSIHEETNGSPLDSDDQSLIIPASEDNADTTPIMDPNTTNGFDLAGVCDLATIEEQPELGYSSESEANFEPFRHGKISRESNTSSTPQLDTLLEQEETKNNGNSASTDIIEKTKLAGEKDISPAFKHQN